MDSSAKLLPEHILCRATLCGNEYAWPVEDIPTVIEAAKAANLINIGGQLQFRIPAGTCECFLVEVDTYKDVSKNLPWSERVSATAVAAQTQFQHLRDEYDFVAEGRSGFGPHLDAFEAQGGEINDALCFVWYVASQQETADLEREPPSSNFGTAARTTVARATKAMSERIRRKGR
jgi:hypothetical protein